MTRSMTTRAKDAAIAEADTSPPGYGAGLPEAVELASDQARKQEDEVRPGPPPEVAARKTAALFGIELSGQQLQRGTLAFHSGLAISWAPLYQVLRRKTELGPLRARLAIGAAMSLVADEITAPSLGFTAPNCNYPLVTHLRGVAAHLAFGLAVAGVTEAAWVLVRQRLRRRSASRDCRALNLL